MSISLILFFEIFRSIDILVVVIYVLERLVRHRVEPRAFARTPWATAVVISSFYAVEALEPKAAMATELYWLAFRWELVGHCFVTFAWAAVLTLLDTFWIAYRRRRAPT